MLKYRQGEKHHSIQELEEARQKVIVSKLSKKILQDVLTVIVVCGATEADPLSGKRSVASFLPGRIPPLRHSLEQQAAFCSAWVAVFRALFAG